MSTRIIVKMDVKPPYVVKPVHFEGLRKIGAPAALSSQYYEQGIDEIFYIDIVASLYQRDIKTDFVTQVANETFVPLAVGGGVRNIDDCSKLFHAGADKVVINTHVLQNDPSLIDRASAIFGSQAVVVNIETKKIDNNWYCYSDCGRISSNKRVLDWVFEAQSRGAGEILLQSVDRDGRNKGYDIDLAGEVVNRLKIPVVVASGAGSIQHVIDLVKQVKPSGVAIASLLHYKTASVLDIKNSLKVSGIEVDV